MGTAREVVAGSTTWPACRASVASCCGGVFDSSDMKGCSCLRVWDEPRYTAVVLEVQASAADQYLAGHIVGQRRAEEQDRVGCLFRRAEPAQWAGGHELFERLRRDADLDRVAVDVERGVAGRGRCDQAR